MMNNFRFYMQDYDGNYTEVNNLTKRQAKIRYNRAMTELGKTISECGWEVE